jgi:uncharacterized protein (DUF427 family)
MRREQPGPGQESVWDYPRPPRLEWSSKHVTVTLDGVLVADSSTAARVLETSHPPGWYVPPGDCHGLRRSSKASTGCEWKGSATYWDILAGDRMLTGAAWSYERPTAPFAAIAGWVAFMPTELDCRVDGERVRPQEGGFYGGWITDDVVGPFKGGPGTWGW